MVRLDVSLKYLCQMNLYRFNSNMVRLDGLNMYVTPQNLTMFQFQYGAIR